MDVNDDGSLKESILSRYIYRLSGELCAILPDNLNNSKVMLFTLTLKHYVHLIAPLSVALLWNAR
ncbi:hypothetical protein [Candidatus Odyssella thessalonicensis]|uniref:hypothetical protein n=1 Tax=Candidatus Odyssella thessalonicensis TaxID=84647 RepID=UPI000225C12A|nr:hypothetical protein [Candidatus Odyssella thessalonicensis]